MPRVLEGAYAACNWLARRPRLLPALAHIDFSRLPVLFAWALRMVLSEASGQRLARTQRLVLMNSGGRRQGVS